MAEAIGLSSVVMAQMGQRSMADGCSVPSGEIPLLADGGPLASGVLSAEQAVRTSVERMRKRRTIEWVRMGGFRLEFTIQPET